MLLLSASGAAWASSLVYEGFQYLPGQTLPTMAGGTGWAPGTWTGSLQMVDAPPTLQYPSALSSNGDALLNPAPGEAFRSFLMPLSNAGSELWVSFMEQSLAAGTGAFLSLDPSGGGGSGSITVSKDTGGAVTLGVGGLSSLAGFSTGTGSTDFFVLRLSQFSGTTTVDLFLNPGLALGPPSASLSVAAPYLLTQLYFRTDPTQELDEIRIGTTRPDVAAAAPEPGTALLLGLGTIGIAWLRRRRQARVA
jgi:hypothetical protein